VNYSIVMAVFNKAALTRHCLETLRATLAGAGDGEVIVVDNASSDETPQMLQEFPWVRVVRNETNLGFAKANNQGARLARGRFLVLMNNDMEAHPGWLKAMLDAAADPGIGIVGAKLLFPDGTLQHAGVGFGPLRFGSVPAFAMHEHYKAPADVPQANVARDLQCVTAACMVTPRELFERMGGFDEAYWNGNEDVDYCLRVREAGLRVRYEPKAVLTHFESQSGIQRFRRLTYNIQRLARRWGHENVEHDVQLHVLETGVVRRELRSTYGGFSMQVCPIPPVTVLLHGAASDARRLERSAAFRDNTVQIARVLQCAESDAVDFAARDMELRGDRYLAFVDARTQLAPGWLDELVREVEFSNNVGAATYVESAPSGRDVNPVAADARCTLLALRQFPQHYRLEPLASLDEAVAALLLRSYELQLVTRGVSRPIAQLPPRAAGLPQIDSCDPRALEALLQPRPHEADPLVSIVTLSWNAPEFTKMALESIRNHTRPPYEVIIVDNGSGEETTSWLRTLTDVRVIFNERNRGFAAGTNQGFAAARGRYVVMLNNDVIVTDGWLDGLTSAFERIPGLGVSAVRSNRIAGDQVVVDANYPDIPAMHAFAKKRREAYRNQGYVTDRAIGLCLCIRREVLDEIGGIDERFGVGNFEDDDFCLRVRAAGYRIYVCNDVFIHHFGSRSFVANKVEYGTTMRENGVLFAQKWGLTLAEGGYDSRDAIARGFARAEHYVPLPAAARQAPRTYRAVFAAVVKDEESWNGVGAFVRRYARAFDANADVLLTIAAHGELDADRVGRRVARALERAGVDEARSPDIEITEESDVARWLSAFACGRRVCVNEDDRLAGFEPVSATSAGALRRWLAEVPA
jgi:GT2 family glycosyltransferase